MLAIRVVVRFEVRIMSLPDTGALAEASRPWGN
jgi:hypothetical protein